MSVIYTEDLRKQLEEFAKSENKVVTPELMSIIENVAKTGVTCYPWVHLKELVYFKLSQIFDIFESNCNTDIGSLSNTSSNNSSGTSSPNSNTDQKKTSLLSTQLINSQEMKDDEMLKIKNQLNQSGLIRIKNQFQNHFKEYKEPPFTIQRLCELIVDYKIYTSFSKYLCAVEKMGTVTSTLPPLTPSEVIEYNNNQQQQSRMIGTENNQQQQQQSSSPPTIDINKHIDSQTSFIATTTFPMKSSSSQNDEEMKDIDEEL
ncbi:protein phosphatase 4 regulatory subunit 2 [Heterostelium album PN500]|uniref:Protein phosphatase 4 regulatory subunit 2 n=1 Tax=Heterostelium pallidum (strain ATCC 26659 / Pp 5 / PN500) TaxID=670386 RepID=D3AZX9_HETP5|nr:protein phosphatase 4 regulatory subunit 2 [Heterostelium album PN500]EFA84603.1 protein phosphatase 4 regulatory subunit 2 [Heterostelium album PN500]|eukprot:XP_020436716.1 protein phosphatase 4 regulatory subunit 2 [Heterostelium album PN500]